MPQTRPELVAAKNLSQFGKGAEDSEGRSDSDRLPLGTTATFEWIKHRLCYIVDGHHAMNDVGMQCLKEKP